MFTYLLGVSQIEKVKIALVAHLFVGGEHDYVSAEVKATRPHCGVGLKHS